MKLFILEKFHLTRFFKTLADFIKISYLTSTLVEAPNPETTGFSSVRYVQASIDGYTHQMLIPTLNVTLTPPDFATTVPAESLGRWKDATGNVNNGCYF